MKQERVFKIGIRVIGGLLVVNLILLGYFIFFQSSTISNLENDNLKVIFLNVGQGDAILIQTPSRQNILIDGGPDRQIIYRLDKYISVFNRKIDLMILTHPDPDHLNGLVEVLKRYQVNRVIYNGVNDPDPTYSEWKKLIREQKISTLIIDQRKTYQLDNQIYLEFIWPQNSLSDKSFKNDNYGSIIIKLIFGQTKFLLTGDATKEVEQELIKVNKDLTADVLKVAHHGSKSSTTMKFLERVKPKYAVISVGRNTFGHPSFRILRNLEKIGARILRTDEMGDILFSSDGENLLLKTER